METTTMGYIGFRGEGLGFRLFGIQGSGLMENQMEKKMEN